MKSSYKKICKLTISALIFIGVLGIVSCGEKEEGANESVLSIAKDKTVHADIVEEFEKGYYDKDELQQAILEQVVSYNKNAGGGNITVEKVETGDNSVTVRMTYAGTQDYASFNNAVFFVGTAKEAEEAGYNLNVVLSGVKDAKDTIGKGDMLAMKEEKILITNVNEGIALSGKALYISDNVTVSSNAKTVWYTGKEDGLAYIVYK